MALRATQEFDNWVAARIASDREHNPNLERARQCASCGANLSDPGGTESESCRVCLSAEFGFEQCEREIGRAVSDVVGVLGSAEPERIGRFVSELALYAREIADRGSADEEAVSA